MRPRICNSIPFSNSDSHICNLIWQLCQSSTFPSLLMLNSTLNLKFQEYTVRCKDKNTNESQRSKSNFRMAFVVRRCKMLWSLFTQFKIVNLTMTCDVLSDFSDYYLFSFVFFFHCHCLIIESDMKIRKLYTNWEKYLSNDWNAPMHDWSYKGI